MNTTRLIGKLFAPRQKALDAYHEAHEEVLTDTDARSTAFLAIDESDEQTARVWHVHQIFSDEAGDRVHDAEHV